MLKRIFSLLLLLVTLTASVPARAAEPLATLAIGNAAVVEGNASFRELVFPVSLSKAQPFDVSASFKTRDITATAGSDYAPQTAGQIVLKAGQTRANIIIRVLGDKIEERDESLLVQLGAPKHCGISDSDGIGGIKDDDYAGQISINDIAVPELNAGQKLAKLEVKFSQAPLHDIEVRYETKDGSARAGSDYINTKGTLLFKPGRLILSVSVPVVGETLVESDETFSVNLLVTGFAVQKPRGVVTIVDDDTPPIVHSGGKIVFQGSRDSSNGIYVINADGTNFTRLTNSNNYWTDDAPSFSHDGSKITYASDRDGELAGDRALWVMNANGTNPRRLVALGEPFPFHPKFSPDDRKIAFSVPDLSGTSDQSTLYVVNADGSGLQTVATDIFGDTDFGFSPDGSQIIYNAITSDYQLSISRINLDGSNETVLTQDNYEGLFPRFTPEGTQIAFLYPRAIKDDPRVFQPHAFNLDGSGTTVLTTQSDAPFYTFCFSPDGKQIAYTQVFADTTPDDGPTYQIRVANRDGSNAHQIALGYGPDWAPGSVPAPAAPAKSATSAGNS